MPIVAPTSVGWFSTSQIYVLAVKHISQSGKTSVFFNTWRSLLNMCHIVYYVIVCTISHHLSLRHPPSEAIAQTHRQIDRHTDNATHRLNWPRILIIENKLPLTIYSKPYTYISQHLHRNHIPI